MLQNLAYIIVALSIIAFCIILVFEPGDFKPKTEKK